MQKLPKEMPGRVMIYVRERRKGEGICQKEGRSMIVSIREMTGG